MIRSRTDSLRISLSLLLAAIIVLTHAGRAPQPAARTRTTACQRGYGCPTGVGAQGISRAGLYSWRA